LGIGARSNGKFHGRVEGDRACARPGCEAAGEFRAPAERGRSSGDGPGNWRWLCLDHVREFNAGYNFFEGMSTEEIEAFQTPYGGWDRQTRVYAGDPSPSPKWADYHDPLDAIGARFRRAPAGAPTPDARDLSPGDRSNLKVLGLQPDADRRALRIRYAELLRRYHPDHNGGDRAHEKALQAVIRAYTELKSRPAFGASTQ
jgi:hypothetical protein